MLQMPQDRLWMSARLEVASWEEWLRRAMGEYVRIW
jgi:hypothetical protein